MKEQEIRTIISEYLSKHIVKDSLDNRYIIANGFVFGDLVGGLVKKLTIPVVSKRFSDEEIDEFAYKWSTDRSVGDAEEDSNSFYDYRHGMKAMQDKLLNVC